MLRDLQKIRTIQHLKAHLLYRLAYEYEEMFTCFVKFWSRPPVSKDYSLGPEFHEVALYSSRNYGLFTHQACVRIYYTS